MDKFNYQEQSDINHSYFLEDDKFSEIKNVFIQVVKTFKEKQVDWALLCSMNLFLTGITDEFNDIDILVSQECFDKASNILEEFGANLIAKGGNGYCESDNYCHYRIGNVDIDLIAGFRILTYGTSYYYSYQKDEVNFLYLDVGEGLEIPKVSLEALYILYAMMVGWQPIRLLKMNLIQDFLKKNPLLHPDILIRATKQGDFPPWIKVGIKKILKVHGL